MKDTSYKKTKLGLIPQEWKIDTIDNHANISTGDKDTQDKIEDGLYPFFVRSSKVERINSYSYDGEAVLTAGDGVKTGKVFHYINGKFDYHQRVYKISDFSDELDGYFFFLIFSKYFYNRIMSMTAKSSVDSVRMGMITNMEIPIPSKHEQDEISTIMQDVDDLIASLDQLIEKKRAIKKGAMQQLLTGKKRLHGFQGPWVEEELGSLVDINMGQSPDSEYYNNEGKGIPLIQGNADIDNGKTIKRVWTTKYPKTCKKGDLIVTVRAPVGSVGIASEYSCIGRGVCSIAPIKIDSLFLYYLLRFSSDEWKSIEQGSTFTSANSTQIAQFPLFTPVDIDEQKAISEVFEDLENEITVLSKQRNKIEKLKQGLMQELLTGKTRLV